jgi:cytochrome c oxidase cbb3-type subunit 3
MSDFFSAGWSVYIAAATILGLVGCLALLVITARGKAGGTGQSTGHVWDEDLRELNNPMPRWWMFLFIITIVFSAGYLLLYPGLGSAKGLLGWSSAGALQEDQQKSNAALSVVYAKYAAMPFDQLAKDKGSLAIGERLFINNCAACHGSDARGSKGFPNLTDNDWLYGGAPETIRETVTNGRMGVMPALGPVIGEEATKNVANYVRSLSGLPNDGARAAQGQPIFMANCAACHGPEGKGNPAVGAPNLTDGVWLYGSSEATIIEGVNKGRNLSVTPGTTTMPSFKNTLDPGKIQLVAAYVWGLSNKPAK